MELVWGEAAYLLLLFWFHTSEPLLAYIYMRDEFGLHSFLFSKPYVIAQSLACLEHVLLSALYPAIRSQTFIPFAGLVLVLLGDGIRKTAMLTAQSAFTHNIRMERRPNHDLVSHGVYRYIRHPGYLGWLLWAVGLQVLLANPLCTVLFAVWGWVFFKRRIPFEEDTLVDLFGQRYVDYKRRTPTWIPGIP